MAGSGGDLLEGFVTSNTGAVKVLEAVFPFLEGEHDNEYFAFDNPDFATT